jgi:uncharacterized protein YdeI (YjbR/CyaY-like superfamily)
MMNPRVDVFLKKEKQWRDEFEIIREIALSTGLKEDLKWMHPCYTLNNKNVFLIHGFKNYCAVLFFKGAIMKDPKGILIRQTENVQSGRQIRFTNVQEILKQKKVIKTYMNEAIAVEESGVQVELKKPTEVTMNADVEAAMKKIRGLDAAFKKLTPGRQRAYLLHFASAKQSATMISRIEKSAANIFKGIGFNEEYRSSTKR